jgi:hypothetical protein
MIEVSTTDVLLFVWAAIATCYAFKYKEEAHMHKYVIHKMLTDEKIRGELITSYENNFKGMTPR